jgi:hypothetical protein
MNWLEARRARHRGKFIDSDSVLDNLPSQRHPLSWETKFVLTASGLIALGAAGVAILYHGDQKEYADELAAAQSIPQYESSHNYAKAQELEDGIWTYLHRTKKEGRWISGAQYDELSNILNSNKTQGTVRKN